MFRTLVLLPTLLMFAVACSGGGGDDGSSTVSSVAGTNEGTGANAGGGTEGSSGNASGGESGTGGGSSTGTGSGSSSGGASGPPPGTDTGSTGGGNPNVILPSTSITPVVSNTTSTPGVLRLWGANDSLQLGSFSTGYYASGLWIPTGFWGTKSEFAVAGPALTGVVAVAAGEKHTVVVLSDGTARTWGLNDRGQLGNGSSLGSFPGEANGIFTVVTAPGGPALSGVKTVVSGPYHTFALRNDGTVWAWGANTGPGQVGTGSSADCNYAKPVVTSPGIPLTNVVTLATSMYSSMAVRGDGTVWQWGNIVVAEGNGGLNPNAIGVSPYPVQNTQLTQSAVAVAGTNGFWVVLLGDGTVRTWGDGTAGQLGDGYFYSPGDCALTPKTVVQPSWATLNGVKAIVTGTGFTLALRNDGTVWGWGFCGQAEPGTYVTALASPVGGISGAVKIGAGSHSCYAILSDGSVLSWGKDDWGQLGNGTVSYPSLLYNAPNWFPPKPVLKPDSTPLGQISAIYGGGTHVVVVAAP